jgi:hypothetical protein
MTCAPLWPTPDAGAFNLSEDIENWKARRERLLEKHQNGNGMGTPLAVAVAVRLDECPCRCHTSTSSAAASPAKTSPTPGPARGSTGHVRVFGPSTPDSFANFDPATSSWRTSQLSLLEDSGEFSETWPRSGMTRNGTAYQLRPSAPLTGGTASGSLPTPTAGDAKSARNATAGRTWGTPTARDWKDTGDLTNVPENGLLGRQVVNRESRPTPTKSDGEGGPGNSGRQGGENLRTAAGGSLNPTWVEWLMGFPLGWTDLGA